MLKLHSGICKQIYLQQFYAFCRSDCNELRMLSCRKFTSVQARMISYTFCNNHELTSRPLANVKNETALIKNQALEALKSNSLHYRLKVSSIEEATKPEMSENDALFLMSLCGKRLANMGPSSKTRTANKILQSVEEKSVNLYNMLLQLCMENKTFIQSQIILEMKALKIVPNEETYLKLFALHILNSDLTSAQEVIAHAKQSNMTLSDEVKGCIAYRLCESGSPHKGIQIIKKLAKENNQLSWDVFHWLLLGLAKFSSPVVFQNAIEQLGSFLQPTVSLDHVLDIYQELIRHKNETHISSLLKYMTVSKEDIVIAASYLGRKPLYHAAYFLQALYDHFDGEFSAYAVDFRAPKSVLMQCAIESKEFIEMYNKVLRLKSFYPNNELIEYLTLSILLKVRPTFVENFVERLSQNGLVLKYPFPFALKHLEKEFKDIEPLLKFLPGMFNFYNNQPLLLKYINSWKLACAPDAEVDLNELFSFALGKFPSHLVIQSLISFVKTQGHNKWKFSRFQTLVESLFNAGLSIDVQGLADLSSLLDVKSAFLGEVIRGKGNVNHPSILFASCRPRFASKIHTAAELKYTSFKQNINAVNLYCSSHAGCDFVIDKHRALQPQDFSLLVKRLENCGYQFSIEEQNLVFSSYLRQGRVREAKAFLESNNLVNLKIKTIPVSLLQSQARGLVEFVTKYIKQNENDEKAFWALYISYLKANMFDSAKALVQDNLAIAVTEENLLDCVSCLYESENFLEKVSMVDKHFAVRKGFTKASLYLMALKILLDQDQFKEAENLLTEDIVATFSMSDRTKFIFAYQQAMQIPPSSILLPVHNDLLKATAKVNKEKLTSSLKSIFKSSDRWYVLTSFLLVDLYRKTPLDQYDSITSLIHKSFWRFAPHRQSLILIDRIRRLAEENRLNDALKFAKNNLIVSNRRNVNTWKTVIRSLGDATVDTNQPAVLNALYKMTRNALPEVQVIPPAYALYWHFKLKRPLADTFKIPLNLMPELVRVITKFDDVDTMAQVYSAARALFSKSPDVLACFFAYTIARNFQPEKLQEEMAQHDLPLEMLSDISSLSYSCVPNYEDLIRTDNFFRLQQPENALWKRVLNNNLFYAFSKILANTCVDNAVIDALSAKYHEIPSEMNTLLARAVYLDLQTNVRFGCVKCNDFCVYH